MSTQSTNIRIDTELKRQAQQLFSDLGMDMTTAVNIFLRQAVREQAIPFRIGEPARPNAETLEAIAEMREMLAEMQEMQEMLAHPEKYRGYHDIDEMMEELEADE